MKRGEWKLNGQSIDFDWDGNLLNGQHRLEACKQAKVPFTTVVVYGLDPSVYTTYDNGRARTAGQLIGMQGVPNYNIVACAVRVSFLLRKDSRRFAASGKHFDLTNTALIAQFESDRDNYIQAGTLARSLTNKTGRVGIFTGGILAGYCYHLAINLGYGWSAVREFFDQVYSFETAPSPMLDRLRIRVLRDAGAHSKMTYEYRANLFAKVWNAYQGGRDLKTIKWDKDIEGEIDLR